MKASRVPIYFLLSFSLFVAMIAPSAAPPTATPLADTFIEGLIEGDVPVSIFLLNNIKLQGTVEAHDTDTVSLFGTVSQLVYKGAISTIVPSRNIDAFPTNSLRWGHPTKTPVEDEFLEALIENRAVVSVYLINGIELHGSIAAHGPESLLLRNAVSQLVFKHAVSTIVPPN